MNRMVMEHIFVSGKTIQLAQGDITDETVDAIVNAANAHLAHEAGVAGAIVRKGGRQIQIESDEWVQEHGLVTHTEPAYTQAGNLPCRYVIHAVGPRWGEGSEETKLEAAVRGSLKRADFLELTSISFPAISTGIFGFPSPLAAKVMIDTIADYLTQNNASHIKLVRVVLYDHPTLQAFIDEWDHNDHLRA